MISDLNSLKRLPGVIEQIRAERESIWKLLFRHFSACDQAAKETESLVKSLNGKALQPPTLGEEAPLVDKELMEFSALSHQVQKIVGEYHSMSDRISQLEQQVAENQQLIDKKRSIRNKLIATLFVMGLVAVAALNVQPT